VTLTRNEPGTTYYCTGIGCNPKTVYTAPLTFTTTTTLRYRSVDTAGNVELSKYRTYTISTTDTAPPVTTASPAGGYYTGPVTVTLTRSEAGTTYYCTGSGCNPTTVYLTPLTFSSTTTLRYYSRDSKGNVETVKSAIYTMGGTVDTTPPVTTASPAGGSYAGPVTVTLTRNEAGTTYYCTGSGCNPTTVYSTSLSFPTTTTLRYYSRDTAGNSETAKEQAYTIQAQAQACTPEPALSQHASLTWTGDYMICQRCHAAEANEVLGSVHYQMKGSAAEMVNGQAQQGKIIQRDGSGNIIAGTSAMNAYCVNVLGNWGGCSGCHVGLGAEPTATNSSNIDCLMCHQKNYKRIKINGLFQPDTANMCIDMNTAVRTVHKPKRDNCLQCHAVGGGGDNFKRGDMALAHKSTTDTTFDRHMATTGGNLVCQDCHTTTQHRIAGRGTDLRPLDSTTAVNCSTSACHPTKLNSSGHATTGVNKHVGRVACQSCHIPKYAKNASDTPATEATETHRDWTVPEWNTAKNRWEPTGTKANNLTPKYLHWDGTSWGYNLKDPAVFDSKTGAYQVSRPQGGINDADSKLYPFKYKTAKQAYAGSLNMLIAIDTSKYWAMPVPPYAPTQADISATVAAGLMNMGYSATTPFSWVTTDEYQLITHEVPTASNNVLACTQCHINSTATQMKLQTDLGYGLKKPTSDLCNDCHGLQSYTSSYSSFTSIHSRHVDSQRYDCSRCHNFSRPERGLR